MRSSSAFKRTRCGLLSFDMRTGEIGNFDAVEKQLRDRQQAELKDNLNRQIQDIEAQLGKWREVAANWTSSKSDIAAAGDRIRDLTNQLLEARTQLEAFEAYDPVKARRTAARDFVTDNLHPEKELMLVEKINKMRLSGRHDEADALELELELMRKKLDIQKDLSAEDRKALLDQKKRIREMRADNWRQSREDQVQAMREQIMTLAGRGKDASVSRALRDAERGKGSALTDEEKTQVRELAELNWQLSNMEKSGPGDIPGGTNELTARGGFASVGVSAADRVSQAIADNSAKTNALLNKIEQRLEKLEFVQ